MLSGGRTGHREPLTADFATLGRHPSSDLRFDAERDRDVSARHAAVFRQGPTFVVRDLGSTNGTWVNGARIRRDRALEPGDRIRLGAEGPEIEFQVVDAEAVRAGPSVGPVPHAAAPVPAASPPPTEPDGDRSSTDLRIRLEVARQTDRLRRRLFSALLGVLAVVVGAVAWMVWLARQHEEAITRERERLLGRVDSLQRELSTPAEGATGLRLALDSAREETGQLRGQIASRGEDEDVLVALDTQVVRILDRHAPLLRAATFDATAIARQNGRAVMMIFSQRADGSTVSATGFVAWTRGDTGWIVTTRHALLDADRRPPARVGGAFNGSGIVYRLRYLRAHDSLDLALLRVVIASGAPMTQAVGGGSAPEAGQPVAVIGFPLGLDLPMGGDWRRVGLTATTHTATVSRVLPDLLQLDGYGVAGASGSPVFDGSGTMIGVLSGGRPETGGRIVYAVPARGVAELLGRRE